MTFSGGLIMICGGVFCEGHLKRVFVNGHILYKSLEYSSGASRSPSTRMGPYFTGNISNVNFSIKLGLEALIRAY